MPHQLLIVDDEIDITDPLKEYFGIKGFGVSVCSSGEEAIALLGKERPDLVILDILLEGKLDGIAVLKEIKQMPSPSRVIILSGNDEPAVEKEVLRIGVDRYLRKPVTVKELHNAVTESLKG